MSILDLERIDIIKDSSLDDLKNIDYIEKMIIRLGFNTESLSEQPHIVKNNGGGILIWQYPNQFSNYLYLLQQHNIHSYMEIGCRWGGTFILTTEYLKKFNKIDKSIAIDIIDSPVNKYCISNDETQYLKLDSKSNEFKIFVNSIFIDLIFIDGDHSYEGVKNDYEIVKNNGKIFVFHDIVNDCCPGVVKFWNEIKKKEDIYNFYEFTEQYEEVWNVRHKKFLGIGVAIKKLN
jgi:cephalosporin hydroxylase